VVEALGELHDGRGDVVDVVGDHRDAAKVDAEPAQLADQERCVLVGELPREDLVSDDDDAGGGHPLTS
jgi:hypothetical protein